MPTRSGRDFDAIIASKDLQIAIAHAPATKKLINIVPIHSSTNFLREGEISYSGSGGGSSG
ncbi:MAG: hypothetical protein WAK17_23675 [Candidatus Nitrosopolaris sp.]